MIVKRSKVFEKLAETRNIFFDKTGTLTNGVYKILKWNTEELSTTDKAAILAIENKSSHPIARSITAFLSSENLSLPDVQNFKYNYTRGIEARVYGHPYEIISDANFNDSNEINEIITTRIVINKEGKKLSEIFLGDSLKSDAKYVVNYLKDNGYKVHILSGDNEQNVTNTGRKLGISDNCVFWSKTPEEKEQIIKSSERTLMVGDGLNDTSAFSSADVGVSVQGSVEESLKVSDAYLLNNSLINIVDLLEFGDITKNSINRNTRFSVAYNITAGTLALFGFINPLIAAVLMPLSSVLLIGSSLYGYNKLSMRRKSIEI